MEKTYIDNNSNLFLKYQQQSTIALTNMNATTYLKY